MEAKEFAGAVGTSRSTATGVIRTLNACGYVRRWKHGRDGRAVIAGLTSNGRRKVEALFPTFNAEESAVAQRLTPSEQSNWQRSCGRCSGRSTRRQTIRSIEIGTLGRARRPQPGPPVR
jgi:DNA-binding MarR family transcriptional regulator